MSTPGLLLFLLGCRHGIPHGPGMLTWSSGQSQTGRVKLKKKKKSMGPSALSSALEEPRGNLWSLLLCEFRKGRWRRSENKTANSPRSAAGAARMSVRPSRHSKRLRGGYGCLRNSDLTLTSNIFGTG